MNLSGIPESTHYADRTTAPWYDPNKLIANVLVGIQRAVGSKFQQQMDSNRTAPMTPKEWQANQNAQVSRDASGRGWTTETPGQFNEFVPDSVDSATMQKILKQAGISK